MSESVPMGWELIPLGELFEIKIGGTPSRNNPLYWDSNKTSENYWVSIKDLKGRFVVDTVEYLSDEGINNSNAKLIPQGTVMMSFKLTVGRLAIAGKNLYTNEAIASFLPIKSDVINRDYLYQGLQSWNLLEEIDQAVKGITLNKEKLFNITGIFPPLLEQQKIASILTSVDTIIEKTEVQINKLKDLKKAMMQELLTKGIGHTEFKDSPVGRIPKGWDFHLLDDICNFTQGVQLPSHELSREHKKGYIRYLYIRDFQSDKHMWYAQNIYPQKIVTKNDIVMANTGHSSGKSFVGKEGVLSNNAFRISFDTKVLNPDYLFAFLQSDDFEIKIKQLFNTAGQPHVGHGNIARMPFPLPSIDEQNEISQSIISVNNAIDSISIKNSQLTDLKKALMQDLLTGKVRVAV